MVVVSDGRACGSSTASPVQTAHYNRLNSCNLSWETTEEKSIYGKPNLQQVCDNVLKSNAKLVQVMEKDIEMDCETAGCHAQELKTESVFAAVHELRLNSPCQGTDKNQRMSRSRTLAIRRSKGSRSSSASSSGSSRSGSMSSSGSSRSSSACSTSSSRSSSMSSSGRSRSISVSSSRSSSSASSRSSSSSSSERYGSSSDNASFSSRGRYISRQRSYRRSRQSCSRSRSRSRSLSCYRRSRCRMSYRSPQRYRSRSRCSRSYQRPRSSLRYRRSRSWSRSPSRFRRGYYGFAYRTQPRSRRSRSRDRSFRLTQKDKQKLLEIAKANADKLLGKGNICLPSNLRPVNPLTETLSEMKSNSDAVKAVTRKPILYSSTSLFHDSTCSLAFVTSLTEWYLIKGSFEYQIFAEEETNSF
ncbi:arginine/serine-rich protein 1 isoform X2 [Hemiscyllium ocellatum]|uniref:arginine/serine-rich protein 1 isoform X2 n=1 Tax=Hemiscyllium ocellatum TaxID=170820 RepID=UPI002967564C|nr:arginine/serine-rich protein 1 isoform X2 [Hemiscyllium ocellatum]